MNRRQFLQRMSVDALAVGATATALWKFTAHAAPSVPGGKPFLDPDTARDWLARWQKYILTETGSRYCDKEMGEELGWLVSPFLGGFYYGYLATRDTAWIDRLNDWTGAVLKRAVKEPDGFIGWPKGDGSGGDSQEYSADSLLGEAMLFTPLVQIAAEIQKDPALSLQYSKTAGEHLDVARQIFQKWDSRDCWRPLKNGGVWVVPEFGLDLKLPTRWSAGYTRRKTTGFTNPANKQNLIASWLIAVSDATGDAEPGKRAQAWWQTMRSRMTTREDGRYFVWNYWDPAGPWDYKPDGAPKHWIGVHPNGGYYALDVDGIVTASEHGLVFKSDDLDRLVATNRDFMWNQKVDGAKFKCIDGGAADPRWPDTPGVLWTSLAPRDETLRKIFIANFNPASWGALATAPWAAKVDRI